MQQNEQGKLMAPVNCRSTTAALSKKLWYYENIRLPVALEKQGSANIFSGIFLFILDFPSILGIQKLLRSHLDLFDVV